MGINSARFRDVQQRDASAVPGRTHLTATGPKALLRSPILPVSYGTDSQNIGHDHVPGDGNRHQDTVGLRIPGGPQTLRSPIRPRSSRNPGRAHASHGC
ncbi:hypothetical protein VTI74DRAFT_8844 [Chaetomium olivicolor]